MALAQILPCAGEIALCIHEDSRLLDCFNSRVRARSLKDFCGYMLICFEIYRQILALANISSATFTSLLAMEGTNIPAFQTFFNYALLNIVYTSVTIYKVRIKKWLRVLYTDGWRCESNLCSFAIYVSILIPDFLDFILAFFDVEGNYLLSLRTTTPPSEC